MKTFTISVAVAALFSYVAANPVLADYDLAEYQGPNTNYTDPVLSPRCTFNDGHGPVACTAFSVVFGDGSFGGDPTQVQIMGSNFKVNYGLNCGKSGDFTGYKSPLPYVLSIRPGNACSWKPNSESYDGTHIKYANQFLNLPTDPRCGRVQQLNKGTRCLILQRP